jgi:hypothetical protein
MELKDFFGDSQVPQEVQDMQNYLQGARREPDMGYASLGGGTLGAYVRSKNMLGIQPNLDPDMERNTISHEYNHSVNNQMDMQGGRTWQRQQNRTNTPLDDQYLDAFHKMNQKSNLTSQGVEEAPYRWEDRNEARSYGLANMLYPKGAGFPVPPHYDASAAQESAILMELAQRAAQQQRQSSPSFTQTLKNLFR